MDRSMSREYVYFPVYRRNVGMRPGALQLLESFPDRLTRQPSVLICEVLIHKRSLTKRREAALQASSEPCVPFSKYLGHSTTSRTKFHDGGRAINTNKKVIPIKKTGTMKSPEGVLELDMRIICIAKSRKYYTQQTKTGELQQYLVLLCTTWYLVHVAVYGSDGYVVHTKHSKWCFDTVQ